MRIFTKLILFTTIVLAVSLAILYFILGQQVESSTDLIIILSGIFVGTVTLNAIIAYVSLQPMRDINRAAEQMNQGNLNITIDTSPQNELGVLAQRLQETSHALVRRIDEQSKLNNQLHTQKNEILLQKELIEKSNEQIRDSISYAKRIQTSLLPDLTSLKRLVKGAVAYYQPKDIVSGDFYWSERVRIGRHDYLIIAGADCTGHGVPGAIMSIMGSNLLTSIVYYQNYLDPRKILARLDKDIKFELYRAEQDMTRKDGMEIGICVINLDDLKAEYAGLGLPLYLVRDGNLEVFKPIKQMAGGMEGEEREVESKITKEELQLQSGDRLYLASDGFQDQFGGDEDKKYMARNFRDLILEMKDTPIEQQAILFKSRFEAWKKNSEQTDDVMILGVEI